MVTRSFDKPSRTSKGEMERTANFSGRKPSKTSKKREGQFLESSKSQRDYNRKKKIEDAKLVLEVIAEDWRETEEDVSRNKLNGRAEWAAKYLTRGMEAGYEVQRTLKEHYNKLKNIK